MTQNNKSSSVFSLFWQALKGEEQNYTEGSINRAIFLLSIPMILEMAMESLLAVVDIFFISKLHDNNAVTAVGLTESVIGIVYSLAMGLGMAATAMVARRIGEKDAPGAAVAAVNALYIGLIIAVVVGFTGIVFYEDILHLMGASDEVIAVGSRYTLWMLGGNITIVLLFLVNAIFRGAGNAAIAMQSLWIANILNMILDPILIFGWGPIPAIGVEGAAIATNIGRAAGVLYQVYYLMGDRGIIKIHKENVRIDTDIIVRLLKSLCGQRWSVSYLYGQLALSCPHCGQLWKRCICRISDSHPGNYLHHPAFMGYGQCGRNTGWTKPGCGPSGARRAIRVESRIPEHDFSRTHLDCILLRLRAYHGCVF